MVHHLKCVLKYIEQSTIGTCTRYLEEGADCTFWGLGGCGCKPGLECADIPFNWNFTSQIRLNKN